MPWRLPSKSGLLVRRYLCTYCSSVGSIHVVNDLRVEVEDIYVDMITLISPYHREISMPSIYIMLLVE